MEEKERGKKEERKNEVVWTRTVKRWRGRRDEEKGRKKS